MLVNAGDSWAMLVFVGVCRQLLAVVGGCWRLLDGGSWRMEVGWRLEAGRFDNARRVEFGWRLMDDG